MNEARHEELRNLLPEYLLGQVSPEDREELESHLRGCEGCREEVRALGEVLTRLAQGVPQVSPPPGLWERLRREAGAPPRRRRVVPAWPALAAGILLGLAGVVVGGVGWVQGRAQLARVERRLAAVELSLQEAQRRVEWLAQVAHAQMVSTYMAVTGEAKPMPVRAAEGASPVWGMLVIHPEGRMAVLMVEGLASPGPGRVYQVWLVRDGRRESGGTFLPNEAGWAEVLLEPPRPLWNYHRIGVTVEPEGGSPSPTGPPVLVITLR